MLAPPGAVGVEPEVSGSGTLARLASRVRSPLVIGGDEIHFTFGKDSSGLSWMRDRWAISFARTEVFSLRAPQPATYRIQTESNAAPIGTAVLGPDGDLVAVSRETRGRRGRQTATVRLEADAEYLVVVGTGAAAAPVAVRLAAFPAAGPGLGRDPTREEAPIRPSAPRKGHLAPDDEYFERSLADYYALEPADHDGRWLRVTLESSDFDPRLVVLDDMDEIVAENDDRGPGDLNAELLISPDLELHTIVAWSFRRLGPDDAKDRTLDYVLTLEAYPYDPSTGLAGWLRHSLRDPLFSLVIGLLMSATVALVFHRRSLRSRSIQFEELGDTLIADNRRQDGLSLFCGEDLQRLECASVYRLRVWHAGRARIRADSVKEPLRLVLAPVASIVGLSSAASEGAGWHAPEVVSADDASIALPFDDLDAADEITLSVVCEQERPALIVPRLDGRIADTVVQARLSVLHANLPAILGLTGLTYVALATLIAIDSVWSFLPRELTRVFNVFWGTTLVATWTVLLASRRGRRELGEILLFLWPWGRRSRRRASRGSA